MATITFELTDAGGSALEELLKQGAFASPSEAASAALASYAERRRRAHAELLELLSAPGTEEVVENFDPETFLNELRAEAAGR